MTTESPIPATHTSDSYGSTKIRGVKVADIDS